MTEEHELNQMVRGIVTRAERDVDVERDLAAFHDRRLFGSVRHTFGERQRRRRSTLLAMAASTVLVIGAGALLLSRRGGEGITAGDDLLPSSTVAPTTSANVAAGADTTVVPTTSPAPTTTDGSTTTVGSTTALPTTVLPTTVPTAPAFSFLEPSDGMVAIAAGDTLQPARLVPSLTVPVSAAHGAQWARVTGTTFASFDIGTGEVAVFDVEAGLIASTTLPSTSGNLTLQSIAVGPQSTVYALYAFDLDPTLVVASTLSEPTRTIASWQPGSFCEASCLLTATDTGFAWEGGTVPYVDADGNEIDGPARPVDPTFTTEYSSDNGAIPTRVDVIGPVGAPQWRLGIEGIEFNDDLGRSFVQQPDGSFTTLVRLETVTDDPATQRPALLWLTSGGRVAAIDAESVPGLLDVVVTADGRLLGVAYQGDGVMAIGELTRAG